MTIDSQENDEKRFLELFKINLPKISNFLIDKGYTFISQDYINNTNTFICSYRYNKEVFDLDVTIYLSNELNYSIKIHFVTEYLSQQIKSDLKKLNKYLGN